MKTLNAKTAATGSVPDGIPLELESTFKRNPLPIPPGMPPEQVARIKEILAKPIVTKTVVTKLSVEKLAVDAFAPPAGYRRIGAPRLSAQRGPVSQLQPSPRISPGRPPAGVQNTPKAQPQ